MGTSGPASLTLAVLREYTMEKRASIMTLRTLIEIELST